MDCVSLVHPHDPTPAPVGSGIHDEMLTRPHPPGNAPQYDAAVHASPPPLIFDPAWSGHHLDYVAKLTRGLLDLGHPPVLYLGRGVRDSSEFDVHLRDLVEHCELRDQLTSFTHAKPDFRRTALELRDALIESDAPRVYVPYGDGLMQTVSLMALRGQRVIPDRVEAEVLTLRAPHAYPLPWTRRARGLAGLALLRMSCPWTVVHHLDRLGYRVARRGRSRFARVSRLMPEPVEPEKYPARPDARHRLGLPASAPLLVCAGGINTRKGVHLLLDAFRRFAERDREAVLLLAGKAERSLEPTLQAARAGLGARLHTLDRYVSDEEFRLSIAAGDVVVVPYPRHVGSSGLLVRAAAARRYVLASDWGWIGETTREYGLGMTCNVENSSAFANALHAALGAARDYTQPKAAREFVDFHTLDNFIAQWTADLRASHADAGVPV